MQDRIEIYLLEQFVESADCNTLAQAAEKLHITQPTLTRSIQKMEHILGVKLFEREKNRIYINANGKAAAEYAKRILDMEDDMVLRIRALDRSAHMIAIGACAPGPLMEIIPRLQRLYPEKLIATEIKPCDQLLDGLLHDEYQLILTDSRTERTDLFCEEWGAEKLFVSVLPGHPMAGLEKVRFSDIDGLNFLAGSNLGVWSDIVKKHMPASNFLVQQGADALKEIAENSSLPAFETDLGMRVFGKGKNRVAIPISDKEAELTFYYVCKSENAGKLEKWIHHTSVSENTP